MEYGEGELIGRRVPRQRAGLGQSNATYNKINKWVQALKAVILAGFNAFMALLNAPCNAIVSPTCCLL